MLQTKLARYALAFVAIGAALALDLIFSPRFEAHRYAPFIFAIILVAFLGDLGSSLTATALAIIASNYFDWILEHRVRLDSDDLVQLAIFVTIAVSISVLSTRLARANAELREVDAAKDRFIAAVSHELRTPVTVIQGWAQMLAADDGEEFRKTAAEAIQQSAKTQARLIEDLLDVSRLILGKFQVQKSPVMLERVIAQTAEMIRPAADAKKIAMEIDIASRIEVEGDRLRLQQIFWNLMQNAVKFTPSGGRVRVGIRRNGVNAIVTVDDDGDGISSELLPHLFDPFRQGEGAALKGGLGLGLAIARQLVSAHSGTIEARSDGIGRGSSFIVRLPLGPAGLERRSGG